MSRRYRITGMHCASCGLLVDDTLEDLPGVSTAETDVRNATTRITAADDLADDAVVAAITALGYQATRAD